MKYCEHCGEPISDSSGVPKVAHLTMTCSACPTQWEGETEEGVAIYIRYRYGSLTLDLDNETVFQASIGDGLDGIIEPAEIARQLSKHLDFSGVWGYYSY